MFFAGVSLLIYVCVCVYVEVSSSVFCLRGGERGEFGDPFAFVLNFIFGCDVFQVKLVATTRSSEEGHKDLRMVNEDNQASCFCLFIVR